MDDILTELSKPIWWISVVVAGIIINLLSSYLKIQLDRTLSGTSLWWRSRSIAQKAKWDALVSSIRTSPDKKSMLIVSEFRFRIQSIYMALLAVMILMLPIFNALIERPLPRWASITIMALSAFTFTMSFLAFRNAAYLASAHWAANNR